MEYLKVNNWEKFQHYKDRNPPWIKLHRELLTDYQFACLQDASKLHLVLIWLLASQTDNAIPCDSQYLKGVLHLEAEPDLNELINSGFLMREQDESEALAECKQVAMPETEAETETDAQSQMIAFATFWEAYPKKVDKKKAEKSFARLSKRKQDLAIADVKSGRFDNVEKKFIPHPTTYLNGERWDDEKVTPLRVGIGMPEV